MDLVRSFALSTTMSFVIEVQSGTIDFVRTFVVRTLSALDDVQETRW
jgi:hypothetical protein